MSEQKYECENVKREEFDYPHYKINDQFIEQTAGGNEELRTTCFKKSKPIRKSLRWLTERTLLKQFTPAAAVVDELGQIQFIHGQTGMFLEPVQGYYGINNVLKMTRPGIRLELTRALKEAVAEQKIVYTPGLSVQTFGGHFLVNLTVGPLENYSKKPSLYIIIFENGINSCSQNSANCNERYPINLDEKTRMQVNKDEYKDILKLERTISLKAKELSEIENEIQLNNEIFEMSKSELQILNEVLEKAKNDIELNEKLFEISTENLKTINEKLVSDRNEWQNDQILLEKTKEELHVVQEALLQNKAKFEKNDYLLTEASEELHRIEEKLALGKYELEDKENLLMVTTEKLHKVNEKLAHAKNELEEKYNHLKVVSEELYSVQEKLQIDKYELEHNDHLLEVTNKEIQNLNEKLAIGNSELKNNDHQLIRGKEELALINDKLITLKNQLENHGQNLEAAKDEFAGVNEKVALSRNELRINDNLLEILKNEIETVKTELANVRVELEKENDLPELLKQKLESIKSELDVLKQELKDTNNELLNANDELKRTNQEVENAKLLLSSLNKDMSVAPLRTREDNLNDKVYSLFDDEDTIRDNSPNLFIDDEIAIEKVHSLFKDSVQSIENNENNNAKDELELTKMQNDNNSIKLPGINTMQFQFRDKYENQEEITNQTALKSNSIELEALHAVDENNKYKFVTAQETINTDDLLNAEQEQFKYRLLNNDDRSNATVDAISEIDQEISSDWKTMTLQEWFLMLAKIEEDGAELYEKFSEHTTGKLKSVIFGFAQEELKHKKLMIDLSSDNKFMDTQINTTVAVLSQQQADYVAENRTNINFTSAKDFMQFALQLEKNYIEVYKRQLEIFEVDSKDYKRFKNVIEESRKHMVFIVNILNDLKQSEYSEQIMTMRKVGVQD